MSQEIAAGVLTLGSFFFLAAAYLLWAVCASRKNRLDRRR